MSKNVSKNFTYWLGVVAVGLVVGLSIQFVRAWTEPGGAAPDENVGAPINTGSLPQTKTGDLTVNRFGATAGTFSNTTGTALEVPNGNVGIGTDTDSGNPPRAKLDVVGGVKIGDDSTCNANKAGTIRYNSGNIQYCDGTNWKGIGGNHVSGGLYGWCANSGEAPKPPAFLNGVWCACPGGYTLVATGKNAGGGEYEYSCYKN